MLMKVLVSGEAAAKLSTCRNFPAVSRDEGEGGSVSGSRLPLTDSYSSKALCGGVLRAALGKGNCGSFGVMLQRGFV